MKNTVKTTLLTAIFAALLLAMVGHSAMASDTESRRATLKGLSGVYVLVERFRERQKNAGFNRQTFQTDVELKLRLAGIKVQTEQERLAEPGSPYLYLIVTPLHGQRGENAACGIDLELKQNVRLFRKLDTTISATTWSTGGVVYGGLPHIRDVVKDHVDIFINAWLSVNPQ